MKYWIFQNNQVCGPYDAEELHNQPGFSMETLVCPEGSKGTSMGDWQRAGMVPALAQTVARPGPAAASGLPASGPGESPEPSLKDLASLGGLQEKMDFLEKSLNQFQDGLRAKESELSDLRSEIDLRKETEGSLQAKIKELEEQMATVSRMRDTLDVAAAAKQSVEGEVKGVENLVQNMESSVQEVKDSVSGVSTTVRDLEVLLAKQNQTMSALTLEVERLKSERASAPAVLPAAAMPPAHDAAQFTAAAAPMEPPPAATLPVAALPAADAASPAPGLSLPPAAAEDKTVTLPPPSVAEPAAAATQQLSAFDVSTAPIFPAQAAPPEPSGSAAPSPKFEDLLVSSTPNAPEPAAEPDKAPAPEAAITSLAKPRSKKAAVVAAAVGGAVLVMGLLAFWSGFLGPQQKPAPAAEAPETAAAGQPAPAAELTPQAPDPAAQLEEMKRQAIEMVQTWPSGDGLESVGLRLENAHPQAGAAAWIAEKTADDRFQVNFYGAGSGPQAVYEFQADPAQKTVTAVNDAAKAALAGKPLVAKKRSRARAKRALAAAGAAPAPLPGGMPAAGYPPAEAPTAESNPAQPAGSDILAAPPQNVAVKKRKRRKKAAVAAAAPEAAPTGGGTTLIDSEKTEPAQAAQPAGEESMLPDTAQPAPPAKKRRGKRIARKAPAAATQAGGESLVPPGPAAADPNAMENMPGFSSNRPAQTPSAAPEAGTADATTTPSAPAVRKPKRARKTRVARSRPASVEAPADKPVEKPAAKPAAKKADDAALLDELLQP